MRRGRSWWQVFIACALAVVLAMGWITIRFLNLEQAERVARAESEYQGSLRLALWRIDSWLGPLLALEAARPYTEYLQEEADGQFEGAPSFVLIHFQMDESGRLSSPELSGKSDLAMADLEAHRKHFATVDRILGDREIESCISASEVAQRRLHVRIPESNPAVRLTHSRRKSDFELGKRQGAAQKLAQTQNMVANRYPLPAPDEAVRLGMFVPLWFEAGSEQEPLLMLVRRVILKGKSHYQGFLCNWPALQEGALAQISDLFPAGQIVPATALGSAAASGPATASEPAGLGSLLATLPASLSTPFTAAPTNASVFQPTRVILAISWLTVLIGLGAVGTAFRSTHALAEKRARFAVAVTHELRTPLTTFRMYTDMLSHGMVTEPSKRDEYIETLHLESERLARLVENVLSFAQLEQGRRQSQSESVHVGALIERLSGPLVRRAESAELTMEFDTSSCQNVEIRTDVGAVEQILFNLVDNACKYAGANLGHPIYIRCQNERDSVRFEVIDSGPGVQADERKRVFAPFERGPKTIDRPGIGLGLALARGLAKELGGSLQLKSGTERGACFVLTLPKCPRGPRAHCS